MTAPSAAAAARPALPTTPPSARSRPAAAAARASRAEDTKLQRPIIGERRPANGRQRSVPAQPVRLRPADGAPGGGGAEHSVPSTKVDRTSSELRRSRQVPKAGRGSGPGATVPKGSASARTAHGGACRKPGSDSVAQSAAARCATSHGVATTPPRTAHQQRKVGDALLRREVYQCERRRLGRRRARRLDHV